MKLPTPRMFAITLIALGAVGCTNTGSVIGSVALERGSQPIKNARVVMIPVDSTKQYSTTADWGGNYAINVKEGDYTIAAEHPGLIICDPGPTPVQVVGNKVAKVDLCLQEEPAPAAPMAPPQAPPADAPAADAQAIDDGSTAATQSPVEVTPLPDAPAAASDSGAPPAQYPPSAPPTYPPAPNTPTD